MLNTHNTLTGARSNAFALIISTPDPIYWWICTYCAMLYSICPCLDAFQCPQSFNEGIGRSIPDYMLQSFQDRCSFFLARYCSRSSTVPSMPVGASFPDAQNPVTRLGRVHTHALADWTNAADECRSWYTTTVSSSRADARPIVCQKSPKLSFL